MSAKEIIELRRLSTNKCFKHQRGLLLNRIASDTQLKDYCACVAAEFFPMDLSIETWRDILKAFASGNKEKALRIQLGNRGLELEDIEEYCVEQALRF